MPKYFFIFTSTFFSRFQFAVGDVLGVGNFTYDEDTLNSYDQLRTFTEWINASTGHIIVGIGHIKGEEETGKLHDGPNALGYANCIIINARYDDPTTGKIGINPFGNIVKKGIIAKCDCPIEPRRVINLSRQVQMVFRIITREIDPLGQIRADNM